MSEMIAKPQTAIEQQASQKLMDVLKKYERSFSMVLPKELPPERWRWLIVNSVRAVPALAQTTPLSFLNAVLLAANVGLEIRKGSAYLIPYKSECQLIIDYRGKMELARRAGVGEIAVELVHETDDFEDGFTINGRVFRHQPNKFKRADGKLVAVADRGAVVAGYAAGRLSHGWQIEIMTLAQIEKVRKSGRGTDMPNSPWVKHWEQMARKTLIHRLCNYLPQTAQMAVSQEIDDAEATGAPMPLAPEIIEVEAEFDPADNRPMVDGGGDTYEEQREAVKRVFAAELEKAKRGAPITSGQQARLVAAGAHGRLDEALRRHGYTQVDQVRATDFDSVLSAAEEVLA